MRKFQVVDDSKRQMKEVEIKLPTRASSGSAGYDFYTPCDIIIAPRGATGIITTEVKAQMNSDEVLLLFVRSSVGIKKGVVLSNGTGIVDSDYFSNPDNDGNIGFSLRNETDNEVYINKGEKIIQGVFVKYLITDDDNVEEERAGGFGSSDTKQEDE